MALRDVLVGLGARILATLLDNSPAWAVADEAAALGGVVHVPLPLFFSKAQIAHALHAAGVDTLLVPSFAASSWPLLAGPNCEIVGESFALLHIDALPLATPAGTAKITFTSGSTGAPKGVCLSGAALHAVRDGLVEALRPLHIERHLCALPLAVLLENVAGLMAPMAAGASCIVLPLAQLGLGGSSSFDPEQFHAAVVAHEPNSLILLPQMLRAWVGFLARTGRRAPGSLRLVAVGGAAVGARLLASARGLGVPAYEGYGLSESASVQTLNVPGADRAGSAGRPLAHARVRIAADGEIEVGGSLFSGYLGDREAPAGDWWPTGDLGSLDADGFLHVTGRKKNMLITGFGRNVAPEWVRRRCAARTRWPRRSFSAMRSRRSVRCCGRPPATATTRNFKTPSMRRTQPCLITRACGGGPARAPRSMPTPGSRRATAGPSAPPSGRRIAIP